MIRRMRQSLTCSPDVSSCGRSGSSCSANMMWQIIVPVAGDDVNGWLETAVDRMGNNAKRLHTNMAPLIQRNSTGFLED